MRTLGRIVGLPDEDLPWLVEKGDALIANTDPDFTDHVLDKLTTDEFRMMPFNSPAGAELFVYAKDMMAKKAAAGDTSGCCTDPAARPRWIGPARERIPELLLPDRGGGQ
ncbi:MAG: hypothetical protein R3D90_09225 [Paracoccaceae bacterium]